MIQRLSGLLLLLFLVVALVAAAQQQPGTATTPKEAPQADNPHGGYLQFETRFLYARHSPEFSSPSSFNEVMMLVGAGPFAHSRVDGQPDNGTGGVSLGVQGVVHQGEGAQPTTFLTSILAAPKTQRSF